MEHEKKRDFYEEARNEISDSYDLKNCILTLIISWKTKQHPVRIDCEILEIGKSSLTRVL